MRTNMKLVSSFLFLLFAITSQAQISYGIKVGRNAANVNVDGVGNIVPNTKTISNYNLGFVAEIDIANGFAFHPELNFKTKGFKVKEGLDVNIFKIPVPLGVEAHTEVKYVEVPLLGKYKFGNEKAGAYVLAGPYAGFARKATLKTKANVIIDFNLTSTDIDLTNDTYQRFEVGAMGGLGVWTKAGNGQLFADARYQHSLTDLFNDPLVDIQMQNNGFGVNVGYMMNF